MYAPIRVCPDQTGAPPGHVPVCTWTELTPEQIESNRIEQEQIDAAAAAAAEQVAAEQAAAAATAAEQAQKTADTLTLKTLEDKLTAWQESIPDTEQIIAGIKNNLVILVIVSAVVIALLLLTRKPRYRRSRS